MIKANAKLSDKQFNDLERWTRRDLMAQLMCMETPSYKYTFGCLGNAWVIRRYDKAQCIDKDTWANDYVSEVVDAWR